MIKSGHSIQITPDILLQAYAVGLFPMAETATTDDLFWVDPEQRGIFPLDGLLISRSLAKTIRSNRFQICVDQDFNGVLDGCSGLTPDRPETWINTRIRALFSDLFDQGHVHTVEAYQDGRLVGGLYGLAIGGLFCGESMFHRATDASKTCLAHLVARLRQGGFRLLDTQFLTPHLASLGAIEIARAIYRKKLAVAIRQDATFHPWPIMDEPSGADILAILQNG